jgi:transcriptional regulator with XRE-family HTH domain
LRKSLGISQQALAELASMDQRNLSSIECGGTFPSKSMHEIATALKVTLPELFDFEHHKVDKPEMVEYIKTNVEYLEQADVKTIYRMLKTMR